MVEDCQHKFKIERVFDGYPVAQILICKVCNGTFMGYGGKAGVPDIIHELRTPITEKRLDDMLVTNLKFKVKK